ncbi:MoxR family ATPase [bacterium]|nr:MoxR family ATPase [bacterium]
MSDDEIRGVSEQLNELLDQLARVVTGQSRVLEEMVITLLARGHALLEGVPGTAKTLAVRALAASLSLQAKRIQFTPDLMPSDIVGTNVFNLAQNSFELLRGPIFTDLLLADEINRAPAKTQSALLEAMAERQVTIDGNQHPLSSAFAVFATQNPVEFEGTYPLPEAQQDRFLLKIRIHYPEKEAERAILLATHLGHPLDNLSDGRIHPIFKLDSLIRAQQFLVKIRVEEPVLDYALAVVRATREHESVQLGAGPRGSIHLLVASKARALVKGRDYVIPDDIVALVEPVLGHRITLKAEAEITGTTPAEVLQTILDKVDVPR